jgi:hypothetical protein
MGIKETISEGISDIGTVEDKLVMGGPPRTKAVVKGNRVYSPDIIMGGETKDIGYVEDGVAYKMTIGGPPKRIGKVDYSKKKPIIDFSSLY